MIGQLFKSYFVFTGKDYLLSFWRGIVHLGKPSKVTFPSELVEQGVATLLSGVNNSVATQSNLHWLWPYWLHRQMNPLNVEFIPTGVNLITLNLTRRNWTSIGVPQSKHESMVDPVGMLTTRAWGPSIFSYLKCNGKSYFPQETSLSQTRNQNYPEIITDYKTDLPISWQFKVKSLDVFGEELVDCIYEIANSSDQPIRLIFGLAIRPYNAITIGHINSLKFKNRLWRVNYRPYLLLKEAPTRTIISDRHCGDPLFYPDNEREELKSRTGLISGLSEYELTLNAYETRTIECYALVEKRGVHPDGSFERVSDANLQTSRDSFYQHNDENLNDGLVVKTPDQKLNLFFNALKNHIHVFDDGDLFTPGSFLYHTSWVRDTAFMALCYENLSWQKRVHEKVVGLLKFQKRDGFFRSQNGEWDSNGEALFTMINHIRHTGDLEFAKAVYPKLYKGAKWLYKMTRNEFNGLLPAGLSAEHFGPNDIYFWDDFWAIAGLKELLWLTKTLNKSDQWLRDFISDYERSLKVSIILTTQKSLNGALPCSPSRHMDSAAIGNLIAVSPLHLISIDERWVRPTVDYLWNNSVIDGLLFHGIVHTGLNPYLSIQLARVLLAMNDSRFFVMLNALMTKASGTFTWPEAINPRTGGGCMGDGDHGWACAEFLSLVREMFVRESDDEIILCSGVLPEWSSIKISNASTRFGTIDYELIEGTIRWSIKRNPLQERVNIFFQLHASERVLLNQNWTQDSGSICFK